MNRTTIDEVGKSTLESLSQANRLNDWMFETIQPHVKGRILEIGSGIGNISECFIKNGYSITLSDYSDHYCASLKNKFASEPLVNGVYQIDLVADNFETIFKDLIGTFDTVFALNVVEHIKDDNLAIANCKKLLKPGGHLIILVPAWQTLYNGFDVALEHFRRYTRKTISTVFKAQNLEILKTWYFNFAGILGWFVSGNILRKKELPSGQVSFYNKLVPIFRVVDKVTFNRIGLSVIIVGRKEE
jgi:2-polyprenyl-3-methyl-5-hydroxy-6-metoxy-1,4-benzoquinol methylase